MKLKIDLHVHTIFSGDSSITLEKAGLMVQKLGLDGIAITDHDTVEAHQKIHENLGFIIIPGIEVTTTDGHILGLGVSEPVKPGLSAVETIEKIHELGGLAVVPHPMVPFKRSLDRFVLEQVKPDAIEVFNASVPHFFHVKQIEDFVKQKNLSKTAGSDAHVAWSIGQAYTVIDVKENSLEEILYAIKNGKTTPMIKNKSINDFLLEAFFRLKDKLIGRMSKTR